jgi:ABC-type methionine transport system ATPase subunit
MGVVVGSSFGIEFDKKVKLIFTDSLIKKPLLYEMAQKYSIITNIETANINKSEGWVILTVTGTGSQMDEAFQWIADQGAVVQTMLDLD